MTEPKPKTDIEASEHPPEPSEPITVPPVPPEPATTPDHSYIVVSLAGTEPYKTGLKVNNTSTILAFIQEAGKQLYAADAQWGYVGSLPEGARKTVRLPDGRTIAADAVMHHVTFQEVSILKNALEDGEQATPRWLLTTGLHTAMQEGTWVPVHVDGEGKESC